MGAGCSVTLAMLFGVRRRVFGAFFGMEPECMKPFRSIESADALTEIWT